VGRRPMSVGTTTTRGPGPYRSHTRGVGPRRRHRGARRLFPIPPPPQDHRAQPGPLGRYKGWRLPPASRRRARVWWWSVGGCSTLGQAGALSVSARPPGAARGALLRSIRLPDMTTGARSDLEAGHVSSRRRGASAASTPATAGLEQAEAEVSAHAKTSPAFLPSL